MSQCTNRYLALCSKARPLLRDGWAGINAKIYLPFCGFFRADGATVVYPQSTIAQNRSPLMQGGGAPPDTFQKNSGSCGWI